MRLWAVAVGAVLLLAGAARAQEAPRALIERAIQAHGGRARLEKARADHVVLKGKLLVGVSQVPFASATTVQLPGQYRSVVRVQAAGKNHTVVHLLDGDKAAVHVDGREQPAAAHREQLRQALALDRAMRLVPLLTDPQYQLHALPETTVEGRPALGVRVVVGGQREVRLYFDRSTALLVKTEHWLDGPNGTRARHEGLYSDHRDVGGYLRAGKVKALRDGAVVLEAELVEAKVFDRIEPSYFSKP
jgi:hypothetical protein